MQRFEPDSTSPIGQASLFAIIVASMNQISKPP